MTRALPFLSIADSMKMFHQGILILPLLQLSVQAPTGDLSQTLQDFEVLNGHMNATSEANTTNSSTHRPSAAYDVNREARVLDAALAHDLKENAIKKAKAQAQADVAQQRQALRAGQAATAARTASVAETTYADIKAKVHKTSRGIFEEDATKLHQEVQQVMPSPGVPQTTG